MADVSESMTYEEPSQAISTGKRHLLVRDFTAAVAALAQGCSLLAAAHGDMADELGEPLLLYGRALLGLSREESGVLGTGVPGSEEQDEADEEEEEAGAEEEVEKEREDEHNIPVAEKDKRKNTEQAKPNKEVIEENPETEKTNESKFNKTPDITFNNTATDVSKCKKVSISGSKKLINGEASTSIVQQNGIVHENSEDDTEDLDNEDEDDANSNLQLAWEILELSKLILIKRGRLGWKHLAETHRLLGELAMESGNQSGAITDLNACLEILKKIEPADPRSMAETHYQLGLAYSLGNDFDLSIEQFKEASNLLECRIQELESFIEPPTTNDPFYTVEGEIKELKELLPEIQEKIMDMRDFKQQACKAIIDTIKNTVASSNCSNGAGPSGESSSYPSRSKPASDISHLVRKKRKTEDEEEPENPSLYKKSMSEKSS